MVGVYGIYNNANGKWYVGQSVDIAKRWKHHICALNNRYHPNVHLSRAWDLYGQSSFEFVVLEECPLERLNQREKHWINELHAFETGYNQTIGGDFPAGRIVSEETKAAESAARKGSGNPFYGKHHTDVWKQKAGDRQRGAKNHMYGRYGKLNPKSRKVRCVETAMVFDSLKDAERKTGTNSSNISSCCSGRLKTAGKYHWEYVM